MSILKWDRRYPPPLSYVAGLIFLASVRRKAQLAARTLTFARR